MAHDAVPADLAPGESSRSDSSCGLPIPAGILPRPRVDFDGRGRSRANMRAVHIEIPRDASLDGHVVDGVLRYLTISTGIAFAVLLVVLAITRCFDRARPGRPSGQHVHGNKLRDQVLTFAVGLALFGAVDMVLATRAARALSSTFWRYPDADPRALRVEVTARQWSWTFRTAGPDGQFGTPDDVVTLNELHVPVDGPCTSSFARRMSCISLYLPNFRTKLDAIPGTTTRMWVQATAARPIRDRLRAALRREPLQDARRVGGGRR